MPVTRLSAETFAVGQAGVPLLTLLQMATTALGAASPNADLNDPIAAALDHFAYAMIDRTNVSDTDLAQVPDNLAGRYLAYLEIQLLEKVRNRAIFLPQLVRWEDYQTDRRTFLTDLGKIIDDRWDQYRRVYLYSTQPAVGRMAHATRNQLDTRPWFPPFPPAPWYAQDRVVGPWPPY